MKFARPVNNPKPKITNDFSAAHPGKDYAESIGVNVYAKGDGIVKIVKDNETRQWLVDTASDPYLIQGKKRKLRDEDYGNYVKIDHGNGFESLDAHLKYNSVVVKILDMVKKGQKIAEIGSTGNSTGAHLHDELRFNGKGVDLANYFDSFFTGYFDLSVPSEPMAILPEKELDEIRLARDQHYKDLQATKQTVDNLNQQINDRNNDIIQLKVEIETLEGTLENLSMQKNTLFEQAQKIPNLEKELKQTLNDRILCLEREQRMNRKLAQFELHTDDYRKQSIRSLIREIITRILGLRR